jgi:hypothetical protein
MSIKTKFSLEHILNRLIKMHFNITVRSRATDLFELKMEKGEWVGAKLDGSKISILYSPPKDAKIFIIDLAFSESLIESIITLEIRRFYGIISAGIITGNKEFEKQFISDALHIDNLLEPSRSINTNEFKLV